MKKLVMTFAIVAFLLGGFVSTAQAQGNDTKSGKDAKNTKEIVVNNYDQMIKDFEINVNNYISTYEKALKDGTLDKSDYMTYLKKAQDLQTKLNNAMSAGKLNKDQVEYFKRISKKLADALKRKN